MMVEWEMVGGGSGTDLDEPGSNSLGRDRSSIRGNMPDWDIAAGTV